MSISVILYRLDTGRTHRIQVPPYMVLRRRTVERIDTGLGFEPGMKLWYGTSSRFVGIDAPQLVRKPNGELAVLGPDVTADEVCVGSVPVRLYPLSPFTMPILRREMAKYPNTDAARHVAALLEGAP
jgi:hypothetical protein